MATQPTLNQREDRDENHSFTLPTGRTLGYARYGVAKSIHPPTIYIHGYPASRLEAAIYSRKLFSSGLQMISIDRPGFGLSPPVTTPLSERTILDHVSDIEALANHLNLERFAVVGVSGGAPYAIGCAQAISSRLVGVGVIAGFGPYSIHRSREVWSDLHWLNKLGLIAPIHFPWIYEKLYGWLVPWFVKRMTSKSYSKVIDSKSFKKYVAQTEDGKLLLSDNGEEFYNDTIATTHAAIQQQGFAKAHVDEARLLAKEWPFDVGEVRHENLRLWYGSADVNTPVKGGEMLAQALGGKDQVTFDRIEGGTHASVVADGVKWVKELLGIPEEQDVSEHQEQHARETLVEL